MHYISSWRRRREEGEEETRGQGGTGGGGAEERGRGGGRVTSPPGKVQHHGPHPGQRAAVAVLILGEPPRLPQHERVQQPHPQRRDQRQRQRRGGGPRPGQPLRPHRQQHRGQHHQLQGEVGEETE